jgi:thermostable 8-oxoguanine DNA glycosylase
MELLFNISDTKGLAAQYPDKAGDRDKTLSKEIIEEVFPAYEQRGYLTKKEFLKVCDWKTPRTKPRCERNDEDFIRVISSLVKTTKSERLRIQAWTLLEGVGWPTASVFLHFAFPDKYPILDFRALWSLSTEVPKQYTFQFWQKYSEFCRELACKAGVTMRELDQALWVYSKLNQGK